ncbi:MAG TPA: hypothetical protein VGH14_01565 [Solirubrobacterales bacterium]
MAAATDPRAPQGRTRCRKYVFSTTLESADPQNTTVLSEDFAEDIRKVKDEVDGVTLGGGKRLFADDGRKVPLTLTDARTVGTGIQLLTYERTA